MEWERHDERVLMHLMAREKGEEKHGIAELVWALMAVGMGGWRKKEEEWDGGGWQLTCVPHLAA